MNVLKRSCSFDRPNRETQLGDLSPNLPYPAVVLHQGAFVGQNGQRVRVLVLIQLGDFVQELRDELQRPVESQQIARTVLGGLKEILLSLVVDHRLQIAIIFAHLLILSVVLEYHQFAVHIGGDERKDFAQIVEETGEVREQK